MVDKNGVELVVGKYIVFTESTECNSILYKVKELNHLGACVNGKHVVWLFEWESHKVEYISDDRALLYIFEK